MLIITLIILIVSALLYGWLYIKKTKKDYIKNLEKLTRAGILKWKFIEEQEDEDGIRTWKTWSAEFAILIKSTLLLSIMYKEGVPFSYMLLDSCERFVHQYGYSKDNSSSDKNVKQLGDCVRALEPQ